MPTESSTERIVVVGAGVAGLAVAAALDRRGRQCTVLEQLPERRAQGYGFLLMGNGQRALERLGLLDAAASAGQYVAARHDFLADGRDLGVTEIAPHLVLPRDALVGALLADLASQTLRVGLEVTGVERAGEGPVTVTVAGGPALVADLVVGADGARSRLREAVVPGVTRARELGEVLLRASVPDIRAAMEVALHKWIDPAGGRAVGLAPGPGADVFLYVQVDPASHVPPPEDAPGLERWVRETIGDWPDPIPAVVGATDFESAAYKVSNDIEPLSTYVDGRVVLVGDAAHPMLTLSTQGASTALEDALVLVEALDAHPKDVSAALHEYDEARVPVGAIRTRWARLRLRAFNTPVPAFDDSDIDLPRLRERAYNHRWAMQPPGVIPLTAADPDFDAPPVVREAIADYVARGALSYGPPEGLPGFREACATVLTERRGVPATPDHVIAADSAASAMYVMARWLLRPGDEAIVFDPVDYLFVSSVENAGGTVVRCPIDPATGRFDEDHLASLVTPRTRMLGVCNPHNPLGRVLDEQELTFLSELALRHDLYIMNDEVWADVVFAPHVHRNIASVSEEVAARTVTVGGFSKSFGLAGLRIGFLAATELRVRDALLAASAAASTAWGATTLSQVAAEAAYTGGWTWFAAFREHLTRMRDLGVARLDAIDGVRCGTPEGTYLLFPDITGLGVDAETLVEHIRDVGRVALVPGSARWFGPQAEGHVRIAFPTSEATFTEALERIEQAIAAL